jgi:hypothetical protein
MLIRLFQQRPKYWFVIDNRHNIWAISGEELKHPDKHELAREIRVILYAKADLSAVFVLHPERIASGIISSKPLL